jgi:hypothetical protein
LLGKTHQNRYSQHKQAKKNGDIYRQYLLKVYGYFP